MSGGHSSLFPTLVKGCSWPMAVPPSSQVDCQIVHSSMLVDIASAWRFLLFTGKELATRHGLNPEDIMLSPSSPSFLRELV